MEIKITIVSIVVGIIGILTSLFGVPLSNFIGDVVHHFLQIDVAALTILIFVIWVVVVIAITYLVIKHLDRCERLVKFLSLHILPGILRLSMPAIAYKMKSAEYLYAQVSPNQYQNSMKYNIVVLSNEFSGVDVVQRWTGYSSETKSNELVYHMKSPEYIIEKDNLISQQKKDTFAHYKIKLRNKRDVVAKYRKLNNICIESDVITDTENRCEPYYSKTISVPTKKLTLKVSFDKSVASDVVGLQCQIFTHSVDSVPYFTSTAVERQENPSGVVYIWNIKNPIYGGRYVMSWDYDN